MVSSVSVLNNSIRAAQYSKINLDIVLAFLNIQDNNRYNIYKQFLIHNSTKFRGKKTTLVVK